MNNFKTLASPIVKAMNVNPTPDSYYGEWGLFTNDAARAIVLVSDMQKISPELLAVTWLNESVFSFIPEPNMNKSPGDFQKWDVGPLQMNVDWTHRDLAVSYYRLPSDMTLHSALGTGDRIYFNGNSIDNLRLGSIKLLRLHKTSDEERAVAYTGPNARPYRRKSFQIFAPLFREFFLRYEPV